LYHKGTLYVGTVGGRVIAFYDDADSVAQSSALKSGLNKALASAIHVPVWGTFQGNNQRTGVPAGKMITAVSSGKGEIPSAYSLSQNYPNPFNPSTTLRYGLPSESRVKLHVYNILGQVVCELVNEEQSAGWKEVQWRANIASGLYFYRIEATALDDPSKHFVDTKKMLLLR
jgi:hypothetical protein